jgi:hypothetical protein
LVAISSVSFDLVLSVDFWCVCFELRADLYSCLLRVSAEDYRHPILKDGAICDGMKNFTPRWLHFVPRFPQIRRNLGDVGV